MVDWLKSKGFDQDICDKFASENRIMTFPVTNKNTHSILSFSQTEEEIMGDVLLELDIDALKNEVGIKAFGKRKQLMNAIAGLR